MAHKHKVECQRRSDGSAWISVGDPIKTPHFQCDFLGDPDVDPQSLADFEEKPPAWVKRDLNLS